MTLAGREAVAAARTAAEGVETLPEMSPERGLQWLESIRRARRLRQPARCPRIFVSHRQADGSAALRLTWLAHDEVVRCALWFPVRADRFL